MTKAELKEQTKLFLASKQNANLLPEILSSLYSKGGPELIQSVRCFKTIFTEIIPRGDFNYEAFPEGTPERQYSIWLRDRYIEGIEDLAIIMQANGTSKLREVGIETLIGFHQLEQDFKDKFPKIDHSLLIRLVEAFLESGGDSPLINHSPKLLEFLKSFKFRLDFVCNLQDILEVRSKSAVKPKEEWMKNVLKLCRTIVKAESVSLAEKSEDETERGRTIFKNKFSKVWKSIMRWDSMTPGVVRMIVSMLPDHIMDHLERPVLMSDFLLESFKIKGPISILALRGIFILMLKYNFEVPDFYTKLYSLFTLPVLRSNYRERFFRYSADFLASTHLPEYLVAAFAKKMARLSLHAPAPVIPIICQFIVNLMISHPGLKVLVHNTTSKIQNIQEDPFDPDEPNPNKTRAMESSLWEMKTLENHVLPQVAQACSFIEKAALPNTEFDLDEVIGQDYDDLFEEEVGKKKNIDQLDSTKSFPPFDFEFSSSLRSLSNSIHSSDGSAPKRIKT